MRWRHATSLGLVTWATPLFDACVAAPPNASALTSSSVTVLITSGPVTNMKLVSCTMNMKSVIAGL